MLAKSVHGAGWAGLISMLAYKAERAGRQFMAVDPGGTTPRDHVSAQVILQRARTALSNANVGQVMPCVV
jgi:transposase